MGCTGRLPEYSTIHQFTSDVFDDAPQPTEGGWGWAAVVGCIIIHVCTGSTDRVFGVVLVALQDRFPESSTATLTAVNGLCIALVNFAGPITTVLMNKGVAARWILVWCEYTQRKHLPCRFKIRLKDFLSVIDFLLTFQIFSGMMRC